MDDSASNFLSESDDVVYHNRQVASKHLEITTPLLSCNYSVMSVQQWVTPLQGVDSLKQTEAPMPTPGPGEVLVEIHAVSLNYRDVEGECLSLAHSYQSPLLLTIV